MSSQQQFLDVIDRDEAEQRFLAAVKLGPVGKETIALVDCLHRVLAQDVIATTNVPSFDRSNYDGFSVRASDTQSADEESPVSLTLLDQQLDPGIEPQGELAPGTAVAIATGGMVPRSADAIVMVEHCDVDGSKVLVRKAVHAGFGISYTATDISCGETVLRTGEVLSSRATGILAAIGVTEVSVCRRPRVAIVSTGNEIIAPGELMRPGLVYDSNGRILADAVTELGGDPIDFGIVRDDIDALRHCLLRGLAEADVVLLSGGTSKGQGDLSYRVVQELNNPGIVAHGVALKPGKPICLAASGGKPVVILPGFPTSAIFTFHEFVAPVIQSLAGRSTEAAATVEAQLAMKVNSEIGRTEYLLVGLVQSEVDQLIAYPMGKGSGSVTTFSLADGFITIGRHEEIIAADASVRVQLLGKDVRPADLVVIGSHCIGLDYLLGEMQKRGWRTKLMAVGSTAGLEAAKRGECDLAGVHLLDPDSGRYNSLFLTDELQLLKGYGRRQGIVFRKGDSRFEGKSSEEAIAAACADTACQMVNRNQGSGTRILIDRYLKDRRPSGYSLQVKNHHAVAAAVLQNRADWGVAIETVVDGPLGCLSLEEEQYDFVVPKSRFNRPAVQMFARLLYEQTVQTKLSEMGFAVGG